MSTLDQNTGDSGFGGSVAISGEFAIVGAGNAAKAFIFKKTYWLLLVWIKIQETVCLGAVLLYHLNLQ